MLGYRGAPGTSIEVSKTLLQGPQAPVIDTRNRAQSALFRVIFRGRRPR